MKRILQIAGLALVLVVAALAAACGNDEATGATMAPSDFDVADYAGKPLVVNYFGSWCGPCNAEAPALAQFATANPDVQFVGIAVNDSESDAVAFMDDYGLEYPVVVDDGSLYSAAALVGVPTTIFYTSAGQEADRIVGAAGVQQFEQSLAKAR